MCLPKMIINEQRFDLGCKISLILWKIRIFARRKCRKMKRCRVKIAYFLLAVYLPMLLLASFHVHSNPLDHNGVANERHSSEVDEDNCLLCQFLQLVYEDTPKVSVTFILPEIEVNVQPFTVDEQNVYEACSLSRAPPVLL